MISRRSFVRQSTLGVSFSILSLPKYHTAIGQEPHPDASFGNKFDDIDDLVSFLENSNIAKYAGWVSGAYGVYSSYQQAQALKRIVKLNERISEQLSALSKKLDKKFEQAVIDSAHAKSMSAIRDLQGLESIPERNRGTQLVVAKSKSSEALDMVSKYAEHPDYGPEFAVCASNHLGVLALQARMLSDASFRNVLDSEIDRLASIADHYIDAIPKVARARIGGYRVSRQRSVLNYEYKGGYYVDGKFQQKFRRIRRSRNKTAGYRREMVRLRNEHRDRLVADVRPAVEAIKGAKRSWYLLKRRNLDVEPRTVSLRSDKDRYLAAENGGGGPLVADRGAAKEWEMFRVIHLRNGKYAFACFNGQYVQAVDGGGKDVLVVGDHIKAWETFTVSKLGGGKIALKSSAGSYLQAENGGGDGARVLAVASKVGPWEIFKTNPSL